MLLYSESDQKCAKNYSDRKLSYLKFLNYRKEKLSPPFNSLKSIRAFFFATPVRWKCWKGTLTVEAALVVPVFLFLMIANCGIYAIAWQQVIKKFSLSTAYANKSVYLLWSQIWAVIIFHEQLSPQNILGILIVLFGVWTVQRYE